MSTLPDTTDRGSVPSARGIPPSGTALRVPARAIIRRIAEEEFILVVLLAAFAVIFLLVFPPFILVNDSWLNLVAGREIVENGLPSRDELTIYGHGSTWTDQQWLAQVTFYAAYQLGGHPLLAVLTCAVVVLAFALAAAGARTLGAGPRAIWALFIPVLLAAPWAWAIRAQMLALPLYTGLLWLLAAEARRPTRKVWLAFPLLVLAANVHGSVALGALLTVLLGVYELAVSRGRSWRRSALLVTLAPLAVLVTPYGPAKTAEYYRLMLVDPPLADFVTEWHWADPARNTMFFYALVAIALPLAYFGRRRLTLFDVAVLALTLLGAVVAIRGIVWFALACMLYLPVAIGRGLESRNPAPLRRGFNKAVSVVAAGTVLVVVVASLVRDASWYEQDWPHAPVAAVDRHLEQGDRVFAPDRFSDWLLWKIPTLRGRIAYDVRFELYDRSFFERLSRYAGETGPSWKSFAGGYRIVLVDETRLSHTADVAAEPGTRAVYRGGEITVLVRSRQS